MTGAHDERSEGLEVSVIVPVNERDYELLPNQVSHVQRQRTARRFEIIVADNTGRLKSLAFESARVGTRVVDASARRGVGFARNAGAQVASGEYLLFCDADDMVAPDWLDRHLSVLQDCVLTGGTTCPIDKDSPEWHNAVDGTWPEVGCVSRIVRHEGEAVVNGANLGVRADVFRRVGGFPEIYLRSQDVAFSFALKQIGIEPTFVPDARVLKMRKARSAKEQFLLNYRHGRSRVRLRREFAAGPPPPAMAIRSLGRCVRAIFFGRERRRDAHRHFSQMCGVVAETLVGAFAT